MAPSAMWSKALVMDDLLREFLTETNESLDVIDVELVRFEQEPNNAEILANIFRLVHTIKGTCGFLGLPRLEALAHSAETLMGKFRDGMSVTADAVTLILFTIDRVKDILTELEKHQLEPPGADGDLIRALDEMARKDALAKAQSTPGRGDTGLGRPLAPGEVSLEELERAFRETPGPVPEPAAQKLGREKRGHDDDDKVDSKIAGHSIRVSVETLEFLMTTVSELVLTRNQLLDIVRRQEDSEFKVPLQRLSNVTAELQEGVMKTRMQPIGNAWQKLPRIVRDLAAELGKEIELEMHGADTELDRQVLEQIKDPLTHMVRNSADHGLETPAERIAAGKPAKGIIRLNAYHEGGHIVVGIADDGRGLDTARIREKVLANGLATEAELEKMSDSQAQKFIFEPGFSTAAAVTHVSGRGVGMNVVCSNLDQIGGSVEVSSVQGEGVNFTIKIPLTLAIVPALIVEAAKQRFAIPQIAVVELVRAQPESEHRIERIKDAAVLRHRNRLLPLVHLRTLLKMGEGHDISERGFVVVTQVGQQTFGIVVDSVFHTEEIVVKPMATKLRHIAMFSGNTILGDGSVIMIIDPNGVAQAIGAALTETPIGRSEGRVEPYAPAPNTVPLLVFRAGSPEPKAVPLSLITRLEEIDCRKIEYSNGRHMVQYRGKLMPLLHVSEETRIKQEGTQAFLVFSDSGHSMGLVVDDIIDIIEATLNIEVASHRAGVLGSAVVRGQATEILDIAHYLPQAHEDWLRKEMPINASARTLLFVDDSLFFRDMLTPVLKAAGYEVTTVGSAQEALTLLKGGRSFDVLVTDLDMPGMDGFSLAAAIRREPRLSEMPIIALSSYSSPESIARGREVGFHDYVAKFDRQSLVAALKEQTAEMKAA